MLKLLLAIDGSDLSVRVVEHAISLVRSGLHAEFVLANVQEPATLYELVVAHDPKVLEEVSQGAGTHQLAPAQAMLTKACIPFECVVQSGADPAQVLTEMAQSLQCHGLVVGSHGHGQVRGAVLGSVSQQLAQHCPLPVTVIKPAAVES